MIQYVLLVKTDPGASLGVIASAGEGRLRQERAIAALGGIVSSYLPVTGRYDLVVIASFPDDVALLTLSHAFNLAGMYVEVLRAFSSEEAERSNQMAAQLLEAFKAEIGQHNADSEHAAKER